MSAHEPVTVWTVGQEFLILSNKLSELSARETAILDEMRAMDAALSQASKWNPLRMPESHKDVTYPTILKPLSDRARALLGDHAPELEPPPVVQAGPVVEYHDPRVAAKHRLADELAVVREAVAAIHPLLDKARTAASRKLCDVIKPDYTLVATRVCNALIELGNAKLAHDAFLRFHASAYLGYLKPISTDFGTLANPTDRYGGFRETLHDAASGGHFDLTLVPDEWKHPIVPIVASRPDAEPVTDAAPANEAVAQPATAARAKSATGTAVSTQASSTTRGPIRAALTRGLDAVGFSPVRG